MRAKVLVLGARGSIDQILKEVGEAIVIFQSV